MKKINIFILVFIGVIIFSGYASAQPSQQINYTVIPGLSVTQLNYQPYPVNPGEYFDLWIEAEYTGSGYISNATFMLNTTFPFSLDPNQSSVQSFGEINGYQPILIHYKVRVDNNAVSGNNELDLDYNTNGDTSTWNVQKFYIQVANAQTDFGLVVQQSSGTSTSIAIANIGENTANSLIVTIPNQPNFAVSGTNGQLVGNLAAGDYTIVNFNVIPSYTRGNSSSRNNFTPGSIGNSFSSGRNFTVEMDYTDNIGIRRTVLKNISFSGQLSGTNATGTTGLTTSSGNFTFRNRSSSSGSSIFTDVWFWLFIVSIVGMSIFYYKKHPEETKGFLKKITGKGSQNKREKNSKTPDWVLKERKKS